MCSTEHSGAGFGGIFGIGGLTQVVNIRSLTTLFALVCLIQLELVLETSYRVPRYIYWLLTIDKAVHCRLQACTYQ